MIESRLILIEGIAGCGKSTVGKKLHRMVSNNGVNAKFFHEFDFVNPIQDVANNNNDEIMHKSLANWRTFADRSGDLDDVFIFDGILSQRLVAELILTCTEEDIIAKHISDVLETVADFHPCIIYLYHEDASEAIIRTYDQRSETWKKKIDGFTQNTEFGRQNRLKGLSGYISFNKYYSSVLGEIIRSAHARRIAIDTSRGEWLEYYAQISKFLSIPLLEGDERAFE